MIDEAVLPTAFKDKAQMLTWIAQQLRPDGKLSVAQIIPKRTQRLYELADLTPLEPELVSRVKLAEEAIYAAVDDPFF